MGAPFLALSPLPCLSTQGLTTTVAQQQDMAKTSTPSDATWTRPRDRATPRTYEKYLLPHSEFTTHTVASAEHLPT